MFIFGAVKENENEIRSVSSCIMNTLTAVIHAILVKIIIFNL